jgi:peptidoglycan hydrolase CwlO-like protein
MALLVYADTDGVERSVTVGAEPVTVGRATECAIRSSDPRVSRNHARFFLDAASGALHVEDLGSSNGVYVGQNKVQHSAVQANEIVLIGSLTFRLVSQAAMPPPAYQNVEWAQPATQPSSAAYQPPAPQQQAWGQQPPQPPWGAPTGAMVPAPAMPPPHAAPPAMPPPQQPWGVPAAPPQEPTAWSQPPPPPPVSDAPPSIDVSGAIDEERKARVAAEEERDAYGARMAELHGELRTLKASLAETQQALSAAQRNQGAAAPHPQAQHQIQEALAANTALQQQLAAAHHAHEATKAELAKARIPAGDGPLQQRIAELTADKDSLTDELEGTKVRLSEAEDQAKSAEARFRSADEELTVARQDLAAAEERIVSEIAAHEQRSAAELTSRVEELEVTRADLIKAEERIVELTRKLSELEEKLGRF